MIIIWIYEFCHCVFLLKKTTKINYRCNNVNKVLDKINSCIVDKCNANKYVSCTHEILVKKKVNLRRLSKKFEINFFYFKNRIVIIHYNHFE